MVASAFGNAIEFMARLGVFDVVLPFLLVFTLMFAFLDKTKIFGTEQYLADDGTTMHTISRKNLNGMASFVIAFFVVASSQLVALISEIASKMVLIVLLLFSFILTVGSLSKQEKEGFELKGTWKSVFYVIAFLGIAVIFLDALGWLQAIFQWVGGIWTNEAGAAVLMVIIILIFMLYITGAFEGDKLSKKKKEDS